MAWKDYLGDNRRAYCGEIATWLADNRGYTFDDGLKLAFAHYKQVAEWLGEGRTAEWAALELLKLKEQRPGAP